MSLYLNVCIFIDPNIYLRMKKKLKYCIIMNKKLFVRRSIIKLTKYEKYHPHGAAWGIIKIFSQQSDSGHAIIGLSTQRDTSHIKYLFHNAKWTLISPCRVNSKVLGNIFCYMKNCFYQSWNLYTLSTDSNIIYYHFFYLILKPLVHSQN